MTNKAILFVLQIIVETAMVGVTAGVVIKRRNLLGLADKQFLYLFPTTFVVEAIAQPMAFFSHNNSILYNSFTIVELFLLTRYFNLSILRLRKYHIGSWIFGGGLIVILLENLLRSPLIPNTIALMYEQFCFFLLAIFSFYDLFKKDADWLKETRFYLSATILIYSTATLLFWAVYPFFTKETVHLYGWGLYLANLFYYTSYAVIFSRYEKLRPS